MSMERLEEKALKLELQLATHRLMAYLAPSTDEAEKTPGRYAYFGALLQKYPALLRALLEHDSPHIKSEWSKAQTAYQTDMRFLHALTIVYWEAALVKLAQQQTAEREWLIGTGMWIMLLSADAFWDYFSQDRWTNEQSERVALGAKQQEELRQTILTDILALHSTSAKQLFATGRYDQARVHIRCLDMCREKCSQLFSALRLYSMPCITDFNNRTLDWVATQAFKTLDEWCVALVAEAEKETNDADAIKQLPSGIRLNYNGGLRVLQPFIALSIPITRVLCAALEWYNNWCYDLLLLEDMEQLEQLVQTAQKVADQLLPLSVKGKGYVQENKLLLEHFLQRGITAKDPAQAIKHYEEALAWDPTNKTAQDLLAQAHAMIYFAQGQALAQEGKFRQALVCAQQAYQNAPKEEAAQEFLADMQEMAPEEDNIRIMEVAEQAFKDEWYDQVIREASRIPKTSKLFNQARFTLSLAYLGRGIKADNLERAESDLRRALEFCDGDNEELLDMIKKSLSEALNGRAAKIFNEAMPYTQTGAARQAQRLLQEAIIFDPSNESARKNLDIIRQNF